MGYCFVYIMAKIFLFILIIFSLFHISNCSQCLCLYATACKSNSDCCAGLYCNIGTSVGASQCLEDISSNSNPKCISTNNFGCLNNADCCNRAAKCGSKYFGTCNLASNCTYIYKPTSQPSSRPTSIPTSTPSRSPTRQPSAKPTSPTSQPSKQPSKQPSRQPSSKPSKPSTQPSRQPSFQPVHYPSRQPRTRPTCRPSTQPTRQPFHSPSMQPKVVPTSQPMINPSYQPSCQPFQKPTMQPSRQPAMRPSSQPLQTPNSVPSKQPSRMPSKQPYFTPTIAPSRQPSLSPVKLPSNQPNRNPSYQPTSIPSVMPSSIPSFSPSTLPSLQPTFQQTCHPSGKPTTQPLTEPSKNPFSKPTNIPSIQPQSKPTEMPGGRPSSKPSTFPSKQPSQSPIQKPIALPSNQPSNCPSRQPVNKPAVLPTSFPSCCPTTVPSILPSAKPSQQPVYHPSSDPTSQPVLGPSHAPTESPSVWPTSQPILKPTAHPISSPSTVPSNIPSNRPSARPSDLPSSRPSCDPSKQPLDFPTSNPTHQLSANPTLQPKCSPTRPPKGQPSFIPTSLPIASPTKQPHKTPSRSPSNQPIKAPTNQPYSCPTAQPREVPSNSPSSFPSKCPSHQPNEQPTTKPIVAPTNQPAVFPTQVPILKPSGVPTNIPSGQPSTTPSGPPSGFPSACPSLQITNRPSHKPSLQPSSCPTKQPKHRPTIVPSIMPSSQPRIDPTSRPSAQPTFYPTVQPVSFKALFLLVNIPSSYLNASYLDAFKVAVSSAIGIRLADISVPSSLDPSNRRKLIELYHIEVLTEFNVPWEEFTVFQYNVTFLHGFLYYRITTDVYNGNMTSLFQQRLKSLGVDVSSNPRIISVDGGTTSNTTPQSKSIWSVGLIAGVTLGSACLVAGVFVTAMLYRKYSKEKKKKKSIEKRGLVADKAAEQPTKTSSGDYFTLDIYPQSRDNFNLQNERWVEATGRLMKTFSSRSMDFAGAYEQTLAGAAAPDAAISDHHDSSPSSCAPNTEHQSIEEMFDINAISSLSQNSGEVTQSAHESVDLEDQEDVIGSLAGDKFNSESLPQLPLVLHASPSSLNLLAQRNKRNHHILQSHSHDENITPQISLSKSQSRSFGSKTSESTCLIYEDIYPENADSNISCTVSPRERILKQHVPISPGSDRLLSKFPLIVGDSELSSSGSNNGNSADDERFLEMYNYYKGDHYSSSSNSDGSFLLTRKHSTSKQSSAMLESDDYNDVLEEKDEGAAIVEASDSDSLRTIMQTTFVQEEAVADRITPPKKNNRRSFYDNNLSASSIDVLIRSNDDVAGVLTSPNSFRLDFSGDGRERKSIEVVFRTTSEDNLTVSARSLESRNDRSFAGEDIEAEGESQVAEERIDEGSSVNSIVPIQENFEIATTDSGELVATQSGFEEVGSRPVFSSMKDNTESSDGSRSATYQDQDLGTIGESKVEGNDVADLIVVSDPVPRGKLLSTSISQDVPTVGLYSEGFKCHSSSMNDDDLKSSSTNISDLTNSVDDSVSDNQSKLIPTVPSAEVENSGADSIVDPCVIKEKMSNENFRVLSAESIALTAKPADTGADITACTVLVSPCQVGDQKLIVASQDGFVVGMTVTIAMNTDNEEYFLLTGFGSLLLDNSVLHSHPVGTVVRGFFSGIGMETDYQETGSICDAVEDKGSVNIKLQSDKSENVGQSSSVGQFWSKEPSLRVEYCSMDTFERPQYNLQRPPLYINSFGKTLSSFDTSGSLREAGEINYGIDPLLPQNITATEQHSSDCEQRLQTHNTMHESGEHRESELDSLNEKQSVCDSAIQESDNGLKPDSDKSQSYNSTELSTDGTTETVEERQVDISAETLSEPLTGSSSAEVESAEGSSEIGNTFIGVHAVYENDREAASHNITMNDSEQQLLASFRNRRAARKYVAEENSLSDSSLRSTLHNRLPSNRDFPTLGDLSPQNNYSSPHKFHQRPSHRSQSSKDIFRDIESPGVVRSLADLSEVVAPSTEMPYLLPTSSVELQEVGRHRTGADEQIHIAPGEQAPLVLEGPVGEVSYLKKESMYDMSPSLNRPVTKKGLQYVDTPATMSPVFQQDNLAPRYGGAVDFDLSSIPSSDVSPTIARGKHGNAESDNLFEVSGNEVRGRRNKDVRALCSVSTPSDPLPVRSTPQSMSPQNTMSSRKQTRKQSPSTPIDGLHLLPSPSMQATSLSWSPSDRELTFQSARSPQYNDSLPRKSPHKSSQLNEAASNVEYSSRSIGSSEIVRSLAELPSTSSPYLLPTSSAELREAGHHDYGPSEQILMPPQSCADGVVQMVHLPKHPSVEQNIESISDALPTPNRPVVMKPLWNSPIDYRSMSSQPDDFIPEDGSLEQSTIPSRSSKFSPRKVSGRDGVEISATTLSPTTARESHRSARSDTLFVESHIPISSRRRSTSSTAHIPADPLPVRSTPLSMSPQSSFENTKSSRKQTRKQSPSTPIERLHLLSSPSMTATSLNWSPSDREFSSRGARSPQYNESSPRKSPHKSSQLNEAASNVEYSSRSIGSSEIVRTLAELSELAAPSTSSPYLLPTSSAELREAGHHYGSSEQILTSSSKSCADGVVQTVRLPNQQSIEQNIESISDALPTPNRPVVMKPLWNSPIDNRSMSSQPDDFIPEDGSLGGLEQSSIPSRSSGLSPHKLSGRDGVESTPSASDSNRSARSDTLFEESHIPISSRRRSTSSTPLSMSTPQNASSSIEDIRSSQKQTRKQSPSTPVDGLHLLPSPSMTATSLNWSPSDRDFSSRGVRSPQYNESSPHTYPRKPSQRNEAAGNVGHPSRSIGSSEIVRSLVELSELAAPSTSSPYLLPTSSAELREAGRHHAVYTEQYGDRSELMKIGVPPSLVTPRQDFPTRGNSAHNVHDFSSPNKLRNSSSADRSQSQGRSGKDARLYHESSGKDRVGRSPKEDERIKRRSSDSQMSTPLVSLPNSSKKRSSKLRMRNVSMGYESHDSAGSDSTLDLASLRELRDIQSASSGKLERHDERDFLRFYEEMHFETTDNPCPSSPYSRQSPQSWDAASLSDTGSSTLASYSNPPATSGRRVVASMSNSTGNGKEEETINNSVRLRSSKVEKSNAEPSDMQNAVVVNAKSSLKSTKQMKRSETVNQIQPHLKDDLSRLRTPIQRPAVTQEENPEPQEELLEPKDRFRKTLDKFKRNINTKALRSQAVEGELVNSISVDNVEMRCLTTPRKLRPMQAINMDYIRASTSASVRSSSATVRRSHDFSSVSMDHPPRATTGRSDEWDINPEAPLSVKFKETQKKFEVLIKRNANLPFSKDPTPTPSTRSLRASWRMNASADQDIATTELPITIARPTRRRETTTAPLTPGSQENHHSHSQRGDNKIDETNSKTSLTAEPATILGRDFQKSTAASASITRTEESNLDRRRPSNRLALEMMEKYKEQRRDAVVIRPGQGRPLSKSLDSVPLESIEMGASKATSSEVSPYSSPMTRSLSRSPNSIGKINLSLKERAKAALNLKLLQMSHRLVSQMEGEDHDGTEDGSSIATASSVDSAVLAAYLDGEKNKKINQLSSGSKNSPPRSVISSNTDGMRIPAGPAAAASSDKNNPRKETRVSRASQQASPTRVHRPRQEITRVRDAISPTSNGSVRAVPKSSSRGRTPSKRWSN